MTEEKKQATLLSLQKLAILAECIRIEFCSELIGQNFSEPILNNFARRIRSDSDELIRRLEKSGRYGVRMTEVTEEYSSEIWRTVSLLNGLPVENVRDFNDSLNRELETIGI